MNDVVEKSTRSHRAQQVAGLLVVAALVAGAGWWATHPDRFQAQGGFEVGQDPAYAGTPVLFGLEPQLSGEVTLRSVSARVRENSAEATIRVLLCVTASPSTRVGSSEGSALALCKERPAISGHHLTKRDEAQLVVEITPRRPGRVVIDGVDVSYTAGIRRGTEPTGPTITMAVLAQRRPL